MTKKLRPTLEELAKTDPELQKYLDARRDLGPKTSKSDGLPITRDISAEAQQAITNCLFR